MGLAWGASGGELILLNPVHLPWLLSSIADKGVWSMGAWEPTGWQLYSIWGIEAAIILAIATGACIGDEVPFCEACDEWTETVDNAIPIPLCDLDTFRQSLEAENFDAMLDAIGQPAAPLHHLLLKTYKCPNCEGSCFLTVSELTHSGKEDEQESVAARIENLSVDHSVLLEISARSRQRTEGPDIEERSESSEELSFDDE